VSGIIIIIIIIVLLCSFKIHICNRLNRHRKEEHTIHNPVYCDTRLKPKEPQKRVHLSSPAGEGKYTLAGPGMPYEIADIDDF
jgi:hypothetical protein